MRQRTTFSQKSFARARARGVGSTAEIPLYLAQNKKNLLQFEARANPEFTAINNLLDDMNRKSHPK